MFYNGLNHATRQMINRVVEGTLNNKMPEATQELSKEIAMNSYQWHNFRAKPSKPVHMYNIDAVTTPSI